MGSGSRRITALDTLRGLTIISMVVFHASYDLAYLYGVPMPWFTEGTFQDVWRASISWTFLLLAGWMCSLSRDNIKRAGVYGAAALLVSVATTVSGVDTPVNFGILFCMAASTLIAAVALPHARRMSRGALVAAAIACLALFGLTYGIPHRLYDVSGLAWLGFPSPAFASGDYYPLMPFGFLYLAGAFASLGRFQREDGPRYPSWMYRDLCPALTWVGRHSLIIYLAHQPLLVALLPIVLG